jgi:hypothetical protein
MGADPQLIAEVTNVRLDELQRLQQPSRRILGSVAYIRSLIVEAGGLRAGLDEQRLTPTAHVTPILEFAQLQLIRNERVVRRAWIGSYLRHGIASENGFANAGRRDVRFHRHVRG